MGLSALQKNRNGRPGKQGPGYSAAVQRMPDGVGSGAGVCTESGRGPGHIVGTCRIRWNAEKQQKCSSAISNFPLERGKSYATILYAVPGMLQHRKLPLPILRLLPLPARRPMLPDSGPHGPHGAAGSSGSCRPCRPHRPHWPHRGHRACRRHRRTGRHRPAGPGRRPGGDRRDRCNRCDRPRRRCRCSRRSGCDRPHRGHWACRHRHAGCSGS